MYQPMNPCPACARHVRTTEARCPFCDAEFPQALRAQRAPDTTRRLTRAAAFAFGLSVAGCSSTVSNSDAAADDVQPDRPMSTDNGAAGDSGGGTDVVTPRDSLPPRDIVEPEDLGNIAPPYGIPADAGPDDDGGAAAEYGAPPMDAGAPADDGALHAMYGLPPPTDV